MNGGSFLPPSLPVPRLQHALEVHVARVAALIFDDVIQSWEWRCSFVSHYRGKAKAAEACRAQSDEE